MKAMVLAAGLGTRLRPLTDTIPKALLPVAGRPLIHYPLLWLKRYGITEMVINLHHHGQQIADSLGDGRAMGLTLHYSWEPTILGTGGGIKQARRLLGEKPFLVVNSDIVIDLNLDKVVEFHHRKQSAVSMVLRADPDAERYGIVELDGQDQIQTIVGQGGQGGRGRAGSATLRRLMFTGVHLLEPSVFDAIPGDGFSSITDVYIAMLQRDERLCGYVMKGTWMDLGTPERYQEADQLLRSGRLVLSYLKSAESAATPAVTRHRTAPRSRDD
ncbi:MAG TPA: nucleotidyltransferase family protein [Nitrospiria bacterium]|nr:nucleotidyltransferase family protein [Nitrospiria bacterium]